MKFTSIFSKASAKYLRKAAKIYISAQTSVFKVLKYIESYILQQKQNGHQFFVG